MSRILLIGEHPGLKSGLAASGGLADCEILTAGGNVDAIHTVRARAIDVVITDPETPVRDDLAFLEELRASRPGIKAIVLAPAATPAEFISAVRSHVFACFVAPFDFSDIADMTKRAIEAIDWRDGISIESGLPDWIALKVSCGFVTAERLVHFMTVYRHGRRDLPEDDRDSLMMAFREMLMNAMEHGAGFDPEKVVNVTAVRTQRAIVYHFRDPGAGFRPEELERSACTSFESDPVAHIARRSQSGLRPGGFGILLAKQVVDEMFYNERGNEVLLIKHLSWSPAGNRKPGVSPGRSPRNGANQRKKG
jgi:anti-sigma regulatory factor (Ser/Thr protein kinase)/CheY-like chemotaxis protein